MKKPARPTKWHKLDNTANIFPVIATKRVTSVFRLTAILNEEVDPTLLQQALEEILPFFAAFHVRLRHGLFWNYLETNYATPHVQPEEDAPCRYIDPVQTERFLFRVLYFGSRVHLETFHVLTDGTGALRFLKAICYRYCMLRHPAAFTPAQRTTPFGTENAANIEDGYLKNYVPAESKNFREPTAFHIHGEQRGSEEMGVITALCPVEQLKAAARACDVPVGEYLTAAIGCAVYEEYTCANGAKRPINLFVPVNLRRIFNSQTSTNFFSNLTIILPLHTAGVSFADIVAKTHAQFAEKCTREALAQKLAFTARSENSIFTRIVPLPVKNGILRVIYEHSNNGSTLAFSNLGVTEVEPLFASYFEGFRFLLAPSPKEPMKVTAISCKDTVALNFTTLLEQDCLAHNVVRRLAAQGVEITLESNEGGRAHEAL